MVGSIESMHLAGVGAHIRGRVSLQMVVFSMTRSRMVGLQLSWWLSWWLFTLIANING